MSATTVMPVIHDPLLPVPIPTLLFDDAVAGQSSTALCAVAALPLQQGPLTGAQQQALLTDLHVILAAQAASHVPRAAISGATLIVSGTVALAQ